MFKKASVILIFLTTCSFFQQEEQSVVSVADTDKGKEAIALGVELVDEREEISDEDAENIRTVQDAVDYISSKV